MSWEDVPVDDLDKLAVRAHGDEDIKLTVESAMETLPDDKQLALSLFYMSSLSVKEIAHFMGVSPNSVKIKLHRARKQLGERLEKMIGKHLSKEKLKAGFVFKVVDAIRDMPIPSLPKPRPIRQINSPAIGAGQLYRSAPCLPMTESVPLIHVHHPYLLTIESGAYFRLPHC